MTSQLWADLARQFGTVEHNGNEYTLTAQADYTNRVFPGWWGDASEGEEYITEFDCPAIDAEGNKYRVIWRFDAIKGSEPEDNGGWLWEDVSEVREDD